MKNTSYFKWSFYNQSLIFERSNNCYNHSLIFERPKNCKKYLFHKSMFLKNWNLNRKRKCLLLIQSFLFPFLHLKMSPQHILEIPRPFGLPPIAWWSSNSLEKNLPMLDSWGFMMLPLMGGRTRISINVAIRRDGLSLRPPKVLYLADSQQLNGKPRHGTIQISLSPPPTRSSSVWMRAPNTLSLGETEGPLNASKVGVQCLGQVALVT